MSQGRGLGRWRSEGGTGLDRGPGRLSSWGRSRLLTGCDEDPSQVKAVHEEESVSGGGGGRVCLQRPATAGARGLEAPEMRGSVLHGGWGAQEARRTPAEPQTAEGRPGVCPPRSQGAASPRVHGP